MNTINSTVKPNDEAPFKILFVRSFERKSNDPNPLYNIGRLDAKKANFSYNQNMTSLTEHQYSFSDYMVVELCNQATWRMFCDTLHAMKMHIFSPLDDMLVETDVFIGDSVEECAIWFDDFTDLALHQHLIAPYLADERLQEQFQLIYFKLREHFNWVVLGNDGEMKTALVQFNTEKNDAT